MKINIGYSTKSIDKALKQIEEYQKKVQAVIPTFLQQCAERIIQLANESLDIEASGFGLSSGIVSDIKNGWYSQPVSATKKGASITIRNRTEKATYIEFGVGQVGAMDSHEEASKLHYAYDLNNHGGNGWTFWAREQDADIGAAFRDSEVHHKDGSIQIHTKGQPATMFAFNAVMDFVERKEFLPIIENLLKGL